MNTFARYVSKRVNPMGQYPQKMGVIPTIFGTRSLKTFSPNSNKPESPYPILFVPGGWERGEHWENHAKHFADLGHETATMEWDFQVGDGNSKQLLEQLHSSVASLGPMTIIVSHCVGAYVAQRYLESFSCAGLVLVNPFPSDAEEPVRKLMGIDDSVSIEDGYNKYFYGGRFLSMISNGLFDVPPEKLLNIPATDARWTKLLGSLNAPTVSLIRDMVSHKVNVEPGAVPMLVIGSELDQIVGKGAPKSIAEMHDAEFAEIPGASHLFTCHENASNVQFQHVLEEWLDTHC